MGDRFVKIQGFIIIPTLAAILGIVVVLSRLPLLQSVGLIAIGGLIIALPNVLATLMWGRYKRRIP